MIHWLGEIAMFELGVIVLHGDEIPSDSESKNGSARKNAGRQEGDVIDWQEDRVAVLRYLLRG